jgi:hypothetical protein
VFERNDVLVVVDPSGHGQAQEKDFCIVESANDIFVNVVTLDGREYGMFPSRFTKVGNVSSRNEIEMSILRGLEQSAKGLTASLDDFWTEDK